jgi:hypothetical protein
MLSSCVFPRFEHNFGGSCSDAVAAQLIFGFDKCGSSLTAGTNRCWIRSSQRPNTCCNDCGAGTTVSSFFGGVAFSHVHISLCDPGTAGKGNGANGEIFGDISNTIVLAISHDTRFKK